MLGGCLVFVWWLFDCLVILVVLVVCRGFGKSFKWDVEDSGIVAEVYSVINVRKQVQVQGQLRLG
jgi:hypothetical protein